MKQSNQIFSGLMGLMIAAVLVSGCGSAPRPGATREYQLGSTNHIGGKQPSIQAATADPSIIDEYACDGENKVLICHLPEGNPANQHDLCIDRSALDAHLGCGQHGGHGDHLGACDSPEPDSQPTPTPVDPS